MQAACYRNPENENVRFVFKLPFANHAIVAKKWRLDGEIVSVKIWDVNIADLATTISYWNTNERIELPNDVFKDEFREAVAILHKLNNEYQIL
jgi:hypothetical protein